MDFTADRQFDRGQNWPHVPSLLVAGALAFLLHTASCGHACMYCDATGNMVKPIGKEYRVIARHTHEQIPRLSPPGGNFIRINSSLTRRACRGAVIATAALLGRARQCGQFLKVVPNEVPGKHVAIQGEDSKTGAGRPDVSAKRGNQAPPGAGLAGLGCAWKQKESACEGGYSQLGDARLRNEATVGACG